MSFKVQELSAYFFMMEHNDPNEETSSEELQVYRNEADAFLNALEMVLDKIPEIGTESTEIQTLFYDAGKLYFGEEKSQLFRFFKLFYLFLFEKEAGPRWGVFVNLIGKEEFMEFCERRLANPFGFNSI